MLMIRTIANPTVVRPPGCYNTACRFERAKGVPTLVHNKKSCPHRHRILLERSERASLPFQETLQTPTGERVFLPTKKHAPGSRRFAPEWCYPCSNAEQKEDSPERKASTPSRKRTRRVARR